MNKDELLGTAKALGGEVQGAAGKITGDTETTLRGLAREGAGRAQDLVGQAREKAGDVADTATDYAKDAYAKGQSAIQQGTRDLKEQTGVDLAGLNWTSVLVGAVLGFLVGALVSRS